MLKFKKKNPSPKVKEKKLHDLLSPIKSQFNLVNKELSNTVSVNANFPPQVTSNR